MRAYPGFSEEMIGKVIGNYQIMRELAQGGMGTVYLARHQTLPRQVVIKAIHLAGFQPSFQQHLKARFLREAYVHSQLDHPNIVRVYEFFTTEENYYLVMEYVDGMSLLELLNREGALATAQAVPLFKQALVALDYAHNFSYVDEAGNEHTGIIHRDIKPANMLLDRKGQLKLTDFGIVKVAGGEGMTQTGYNPGTAAYMSPEQIRSLELDARSDIYSLGVTFYQMLAGRLPFPPSSTGSDYEVLKGHMELEPPPITQFQPDVPAALVALVMRALKKQPEERFQTAAEFLEAMIDFEHRLDTAATQLLPETRRAATAATILVEEKQTVELPGPKAAQAQTEVTTRATIQEETLLQAGSITTSSVKRRRALLMATAAVMLIGIGAAGAFLLTGREGENSLAGSQAAIAPAPESSSPAASNAAVSPTPSPQSTAAQTKTIRETETGSAKLIRAREYERQERYWEAIAMYEDYLSSHARAADAAVVAEHVARLKKFQGLLTAAELEMKQQDYRAAMRDYRAALMIKPESKLAQAGLDEAVAQAAKSYSPQGRPFQTPRRRPGEPPPDLARPRRQLPRPGNPLPTPKP